MRVLITWGSKRGGTEGIARMLADALRDEGIEVLLLPAEEALRVASFDAAIVGGALYANRWHGAARRFVRRREALLRRVPAWFFSSGPLDDSAVERPIPPTRQVSVLMDCVGAQGHMTFGGRLAPDARGFPARAMAKEHAGDWRSKRQICDWAKAIAQALPSARPRAAIAPPGRTLVRLWLHGLLAWLVCALVMAGLLRVASLAAAVTMHALLVPAIFGAVAWHYFRPPGARAPLSTALLFAGIVLGLDGLLVMPLQGTAAPLRSIAGFWVPIALVLVVTWAIGELMSMLPTRGVTHSP